MANLGYLQLTRNCYQKCQFCSNPPTGVHLDEAEMRRNIDRLVEMGYDGVILTGGEPSISELLFPALSYAREKKLFSRMITNGQKLAEKDFFKRCVDAGLTHIHVSLHSYRREVHDFITQYRGAWDLLVRCLENVPEMGVTSDINTVINVYNCDHLHENVRWICENFPFIRHFVWNNMDPDGNRAEENPDCIPRHYEFQVSLEKAMDYLVSTGRSFRAARVPLCSQDHQGRGALHPLPRLQGIHPPEGVPAREGKCLRRLPLRPHLRGYVLDGEDLRRARALADLRGPHGRDRGGARTRAVARAPVAAAGAARPALDDGAAVDRAT